MRKVIGYPLIEENQGLVAKFLKNNLKIFIVEQQEGKLHLYYRMFFNNFVYCSEIEISPLMGKRGFRAGEQMLSKEIFVQLGNELKSAFSVDASLYSVIINE